MSVKSGFEDYKGFTLQNYARSTLGTNYILKVL